MTQPIFTVGHSTHTLDAFLALLARHRVVAVADVRSQPLSRRQPQFNREALASALAGVGVRYVFLGRELGARREEPGCYVDGVARYERIACAPAFREGLLRVTAGAAKMRLALMCAEKDPIACHRTLLVSRALAEQGHDIRHILADGGLETHSEAEARLMAEEGFAPGQLDIFGAGGDVAGSLGAAYLRRAQRTAYRNPDHEDEHEGG